jgi:hypothetical protein
MEIVEILSYFVNNKKDTIEVKFRLSDDSDEEIRIDEIDLKESDDFGYSLIVEDFGFFEDEEDDFLKDEDVNEDELKSFLNEYYMIYPERLPQKDLF